MAKGLELYWRVYDWLRSGERGQTTAEYVAVTAVAVALAITVLWGVLNVAIDDAVTGIADAITGFINDRFPDAPATQ